MKLKIYKNEKKKAEPEKKTKYIKKNKGGKKRKEKKKVPTDCSQSPAQCVNSSRSNTVSCYRQKKLQRKTTTMRSVCCSSCISFPLARLLLSFFLSPSLLFFFFSFFFLVFFPSVLSTNADPSIDGGLRGGVEHEK